MTLTSCICICICIPIHRDREQLARNDDAEMVALAANNSTLYRVTSAQGECRPTADYGREYKYVAIHIRIRLLLRENLTIEPNRQ